jgi:hypothetical protein
MLKEDSKLARMLKDVYSMADSFATVSSKGIFWERFAYN